MSPTQDQWGWMPAVLELIGKMVLWTSTPKLDSPSLSISGFPSLPVRFLEIGSWKWKENNTLGQHDAWSKCSFFCNDISMFTAYKLQLSDSMPLATQ